MRFLVFDNEGGIFVTFGEIVALIKLRRRPPLFLNSAVERIHLQLGCLKSFFLKGEG
jgi:hypothetical protein